MNRADAVAAASRALLGDVGSLQRVYHGVEPAIYTLIRDFCGALRSTPDEIPSAVVLIPHTLNWMRYAVEAATQSLPIDCTLTTTSYDNVFQTAKRANNHGENVFMFVDTNDIDLGSDAWRVLSEFVEFAATEAVCRIVLWGRAAACLLCCGGEQPLLAVAHAVTLAIPFSVPSPFTEADAAVPDATGIALIAMLRSTSDDGVRVAPDAFDAATLLLHRVATLAQARSTGEGSRRATDVRALCLQEFEEEFNTRPWLYWKVVTCHTTAFRAVLDFVAPSPIPATGGVDGRIRRAMDDALFDSGFGTGAAVRCGANSMRLTVDLNRLSARILFEGAAGPSLSSFSLRLRMLDKGLAAVASDSTRNAVATQLGAFKYIARVEALPFDVHALAMCRIFYSPQAFASLPAAKTMEYLATVAGSLSEMALSNGLVRQFEVTAEQTSEGEPYLLLSCAALTLSPIAASTYARFLGRDVLPALERDSSLVQDVAARLVQTAIATTEAQLAARASAGGGWLSWVGLGGSEEPSSVKFDIATSKLEV